MKPRTFEEVVIDQLVINHALQACHQSNPEKAVMDLILYETQIALDPAVSKEAQDLVTTGYQRGFEEASKAYAAAIRAKLGDKGLVDGILTDAKLRAVSFFPPDFGEKAVVEEWPPVI